MLAGGRRIVDEKWCLRSAKHWKATAEGRRRGRFPQGSKSGLQTKEIPASASSTDTKASRTKRLWTRPKTGSGQTSDEDNRMRSQSTRRLPSLQQHFYTTAYL